MLRNVGVCFQLKMVQGPRALHPTLAAYDLAAFKAAAQQVRSTVIATKSAAALGFGRAEMERVIQTTERRHFYKSITSLQDHRIWQDVYHIPSQVGTLYVKFTADAVTEFLLLSYKEKEND